LLCGFFQPSKNVVDVGVHTRQVIDRVKGSFPPDLFVEEVVYQPTEVAASVSDLMSNMLQGIVLVIVVVFVGMGLRNAIIVSTVIPLSLLFTFATMSLMNIKVHQVSIAALIIALGMLVDNAIVVSDAVQVRIDKGMDKAKAALEGAVESAIPVLTSTLTTIAAFSPLLLLPGMAGEFLSSIPLIVIISLSASYVVAMLVTPAVASIFFRPLRTVSYREGLARQAFRRWLATALTRPKRVLVGAALAVAVALCLIPLLGVRFFPYTDKPLAYVDVTSELSNLDATEEVVAEVEKVLREQKEVWSVTSSVGDGLPKFYITLPNSIRADDFGQVLFKFDLKKGGRFESNEQFVRHVQRQLQLRVLSGAAVVRMLQQGEPVKAPVVVRLSGDDIEPLEAASAALESKIRAIPGVAAVTSDLPRRAFELNVDVDDDIASSMGISKYDIQRQLSIALYGSPASVFRKLGKEYDIVVRSDIDSKEALENLAIKSSLANNKVLVKQFAHVGLRSKLETLVHYQRQRSVAVTADVLPGHSSSKIEDNIEKDVLPTLGLKDVTAIFDGEREKIAKNFGNVGVSALFALVACYLILLLQFGSFLQPLVILVTVPLAIIGAMFGLFFTAQPMSFTALLGIASLIGIVVNNAILLLEFINLARKRGMSLDKACQDAVSRRFRPIFLTTITTVVGLLPLTLSGSAMFTPMAVALMFGLFGSTILTMVIIPVVYYQVEAALERRRVIPLMEMDIEIESLPGQQVFIPATADARQIEV
ncbi:MAG: efflux RND transporter permease subunit, partial [Myxococcota bacterium]|nr:efflux RND transporter permease subunit [Myxococcota bacterium]